MLWMSIGLALSQTIRVDTTLHPKELLSKHFLGKGVQVLDYRYQGDKRQIGLFTDPTNILGLNKGVVLSTGLAWDASRSNSYQTAGVPDANTTINPNSLTDTNLIKLTGNNQRLYDRALIQIRFRTSGDSLRFRFLFASEEYPEFAPPNPLTFNDVFGFFIQGPGFPQMTNVALLPGTATPISINNVNSVTNIPFFVKSDALTDARYNIFAFNGGTIAIPIEVKLAPCSEYTIIIAIVDVGDPSRDSAIFLEANSFSGNGYSVRAVSNYADTNGNPTAREGCGQDLSAFEIYRSDSTAQLNLGLNVNGSALNGTDYPAISNQIRFNAGQSTVRIPVTPIYDSINEPVETVIFSVNDPLCPGQVLRDTLRLENREGMNVRTNNDQKNIQICGSGLINLTALVTNRNSNEVFYEWLKGVKPPSPNPDVTVSVDRDTFFVVRYIDVCPQIPTVTDTVQVKTTYNLNLTLTADTTICEGNNVELKATASGGDGNYTFTWNNGLGTGDTKTVSPNVTTDYEVVVTDNCGSTAQRKTVRVTVLKPNGVLTISSAPRADTTICPNTDYTIRVEVSGGTGVYNFEWANGLGNTNQITVRPATDTRYELTVSDGCTSIRRTFFVRPAQQLLLQRILVDSVCIGQKVQLQVRRTGGVPPYQYSWRWNNDGGGSNEVAPEVTVTQTTTYTVTVRDACDSVASRVLTVNARPALALISNSTYITCPNQPVTVTLRASGGDGNYTFSWSDNLGTGSTKQLPAVAKTYQVTITDGCGSPPQTVNITVRIPEVATASFTLSSKTVCVNDTVTVNYSGTILAGANYVWDFGGLSVVSGSEAGPFQLTGRQTGAIPLAVYVVSEGCTSNVFTDTIRIIQTPTPDFEQPEPQCLGGNNFNFLNLTPNIPELTYQWDFGGQAVPNTSLERNPQNVQFQQAGVFNVRLTIRIGTNACLASIVKQVVIKSSPEPPIASSSTVCRGFSAVLMVNNVNPDYVYQWYDVPIGGKVLTSEPLYTTENLTSRKTFYVEAVNDVGCASFPRTAVPVQVGGISSLDIAISERELIVPLSSVTFKAIFPEADTSQADFYFWTFGDGSSSTLREPVHTYQDYGTYDITLTISDDTTGCFNSVVKTDYVVVREGTLLQVPSAFSPNDDLINDEFFVIHRLITEFNIKIFNSWGDLVFESNDPDFRWYGFDPKTVLDRPRGNLQPQGVYAYVIRAKSYDGKPIDLKGTITIIR
jgi:PKD repeat protein